MTAARTSLSLRKRANHSRVTAGGAVRYALTVRNRGTRRALAVRVCDTLPSGLGRSCRRRSEGPGPHGLLDDRVAGGPRDPDVHAQRARRRGRSTRRITNRATAKGSNTRAAAGRATITVERPSGGGVTG